MEPTKAQREEVVAATSIQQDSLAAQLALQTALAMYTYEGAQVWARFNAMLVAHGILLVVIGQLLITATNRARDAVFTLSIVGLGVSILWFAIMVRGFGYYDAYLDAVQQVEATHLSIRVFPFRPKMPRILRGIGSLPVRYAAYIVIVLFGILYLGGLVSSFLPPPQTPGN